MQQVRTILCPIDFSAATRRQTELAADLCRVFGARLVLHHNIDGLSAGMAVGWMYAADHPPASEASADRRMQEFMKSLPSDIPAIAHVTRGQLSQTVIGLVTAVGADLVVLSTHGEGQADPDADDHTSLAEQVLDRAACAVIALHQPAVEPNTPRFAPAGQRQVLVVPTDFTAGSQAAVDFACDLSRKIPFELHLVHFLPSRAGEQARDFVGEARRRLNDMLPKDLAGSATLHVETGDAVRGIPDAARRLHAACIVMGEHNRRPLRRWLSRDTARAVLHEAPCPVWYVPGQRVAGGSVAAAR